MAIRRRVFYSFHYVPDNWRASQVRNMGVVEGNPPASDNDWESITQGGDAAIRRWIDDQMKGKSCVTVLIGSQTAGRKWIDYEIEKAWKDGKGLLGIYIHGLKNPIGDQSTKGANPFDKFTVGQRKLSSIVRRATWPCKRSTLPIRSSCSQGGRSLSVHMAEVNAHNTPYQISTNVYDYIKTNLADWIEEAISIRSRYP